MSELIQHECGIALVRLLKPLEYYQNKYGTWAYGMQKLYLLMEKQHNRGQDGAGAVCVKLNLNAGKPYIHRKRSVDSMPIKDIFDKIEIDNAKYISITEEQKNDMSWVKENFPFAGELYLGHLRYGTFGGNLIENVHPVIRENNWRSRNLVLAGNFNLTNVDELFDILVALGQHPKDFSDTVTILENVGHFLDEENQGLFELFKKRGNSNKDISTLIEKNIDLQNILRNSSKKWDGGYAIAGILGHGDAFVMRDPAGIRPAYYYHDEEIAVVASERPVIQTVLNVPADMVHEITPGHAFIIKKDGDVSLKVIKEATKKRSCSFERIYFSRGSDTTIYKERKMLGELLTPQILEAIDYDLDNTVFSYIPNTAESAFFGMIKGVEKYILEQNAREILALGNGLTPEKLKEINDRRPRVEKVAIKDLKMRTFISQEKGRNDLVAHIYDITYGTLRANVDTLVIIDDSIVRGTTLQKSILAIIDRLEPKRVVVVSSSPQIRYPDCYGIDMSNLSDFIAFRATIELLKDTNNEHLLNSVLEKCEAQLQLPKEEIKNHVTEIYAPFTDQQISDKIAAMLKGNMIKAEVKVVYQTVENLHIACPNDLGDWYFTGDYPTPGGNKVVNKAFINYIQGVKGRAY